MRAFYGTLQATGCRISEALALTLDRVDLAERVVMLKLLKKRRGGICRVVPVSLELLDTFDLMRGIREAQRRGQGKALLWLWSRMTVFWRVREVMVTAGITDGPHACPKGLRHGFGM